MQFNRCHVAAVGCAKQAWYPGICSTGYPDSRMASRADGRVSGYSPDIRILDTAEPVLAP